MPPQLLNRALSDRPPSWLESESLEAATRSGATPSCFGAAAAAAAKRSGVRRRGPRDRRVPEPPGKTAERHGTAKSAFGPGKAKARGSLETAGGSGERAPGNRPPGESDVAGGLQGFCQDYSTPNPPPAPGSLPLRGSLAPAMAGALPAGPRESLPCAAPTPLPPPSPCCTPDPAVALTPERSGPARAAGGILRREQQEKPAPRHVRFRIAEQKEERPGDPRGLSWMARRELRGAPARSRSPPAPNQLGAPLPHSSLALGAEVRATRQQAFDARQAAEQLVQRSFGARCAAEARVGEGLNIPREQQLYRGLISLQVPADEVLSSAVQGRLALVQHHPGDRKEAAGEGPDLMAFYRPRELFTETPFLEVGGLPPLKLQAQGRHPATTFLMYRKLQQWAS